MVGTRSDGFLHLSSASAKERKEGGNMSLQTVQALMDYLVDPVLPLKNHPPPQDPSLQESVARQMHAVVLLYNYYYRKQFPKSEFLDFASFCNLALNAQPNLNSFFTTTPHHKNNLSPTEKQIMSACNISLALHSSMEQDAVTTPVSRVAVFLTDGRRQNCALQYSAITQGVWSLIEIDDDNSHPVSRESSNWPVKPGNANHVRLQKLAMSIVKEQTGVDPREISILESHVTYSLRDDKTTTRLFIMKCNTVDAEVFQVPIQDAIDSLQGPLVKKSGNSYVTEDIVEYFHLLPYAGMITDWFYREVLAKEGNTKNKFYSKRDVPTKIEALENSEGSPVICQNADFAVRKTNIAKQSDQKESGDHHAGSCRSIAETGSPEGFPINEERETTLRTPDDSVVAKLPMEGDFRSTRHGSSAKEEMVTTVTEASATDRNVDGAEASCHVGANTVCPVVAGEQVLVISATELIDCDDPSTRSDTQKSAGSSVGEKRMLDFVHGEGDEVEEDMLKELMTMQFPRDDESDIPLGSHHKVLLTDAILKAFNADQTTSMIRKAQVCKKWAEAEEIRVEILNHRNEFLGQKRKRLHLDVSSDAINICSRNVCCSKDVMMNDAAEKLCHFFPKKDVTIGPVAGHCLDPPTDSLLDVTMGRSLHPDPLLPKGIDMQNDLDGHHLDVCMDGNAEKAYKEEDATSPVNGVLGMLVEKVETQGLAIPRSMSTENIVHVGSVCFPGKYLKLYERIVVRFGDIIIPESKEARLCCDMVSTALKGLLEVIDSMSQVSPFAVDAVMLEAWELKLEFSEYAGLKVGWLRDHFVGFQQASIFDGDALFRELEERQVVLSGLLEAKRKQAADLCNELEVVRAEEKALLEQKASVAADLEDVRLKKERFGSLHSSLNI